LNASRAKSLDGNNDRRGIGPLMMSEESKRKLTQIATR